MEGRRDDSRVACLGAESAALAASCWFGVPAMPESYVRRPRLLELLEKAVALPLVLVSGPAGSGKTSLVADWVDHRTVLDPTKCTGPERTEWVTFERGDDAFWPGVLGGLARLGVAAPSRSLAAGAGGVDRQQLTALAMGIAKHPVPLSLVLDGYELTSREIAGDLDFLLRHSGHRLHLVLVTRVDPIVPLYRYRLEETLAEVRMSDLAFTDTEAAELLTRAGVSLTAESVHELNARTHGWVAGLRFASKFLGQSENADLAVAQITGDSGDIGEYLMGEVLTAQTPAHRDLLLSTSIPDTLQPGLSEELGGRSATRDLSFLARVNAFVEPVPEHPGFFRYHPFFRDLLRAELAYQAPEKTERLQGITARWFAQQGLLSASVGHFAAIQAWDEAAGTVVDQLAIGELLVDNSDGTLTRTLRSMPEDISGPAAFVVRAALALARGESQRSAVELAQVPESSTLMGDERGQALSLAMSVLHSVRARSAGNPSEAVELAEAAGVALGNRDHHLRVEAHLELSALVFASKGIAALRRGELTRAHAFFTEGAEAATGLGSEALLLECRGYLALIACIRNQLSLASELAGEAVATADDIGIRGRDRPSAAQLALAWVHMERYELDAAGEHVKLAALSDPLLGDPVPGTILSLVRSRLQMAHGDLTGAIATVQDASAEIPDATSWPAAQLRLETAHLMVRNDDPAGAVTEVEGLERTYPAETALVLAEARLDEGDDDASRRALADALGHGTPHRVQVAALLVEASRQLRNGSPANARSALDRSVRLAASEGVRRPFREASPAVAKLLPHDTSLRGGNRHSSLSSKGATRSTTRTVIPAPTESGRTLVVEKLTEKELEVLGHLAELLSTEEIAETMFVSVNTIRTHVRNILRKLGVPRRNAAVRRARELQLLPL
jgi:LuxR family maltose regulon positive regulatory protein